MKTKFYVLLLFAILCAGSIWLNSTTTAVATGFSGYVLGLWDSASHKVANTLKQHFYQAEHIAQLEAKNAELERDSELLGTFATELNNLIAANTQSEFKPEVTLSRVLGYASISDYTKLWLEIFRGFSSDKIYGLISDGKTLGIAIEKDGRPLAILQNDPKSSFSVYIGKNRVPGVASGNRSGVVVKFIPKWLDVKQGDEVYTSGLDGIFFTGVPVGQVVKVTDENSYQEALLKPYNDLFAPSYLYVITKER
ncbi:rod shape-determining protein MreC [Campylobacter sp. 19-13652]|uniref:rod shape-determining protein MreC n=1 Tax=Campylobacter sp. 19-13652 TaxID=2840180 RepID=UPI001C780789|nr:rod shape-determining protein MreC [Campylobacter sp. 19-13652]BCX78696.1 rod shape-determining protein MreC [Campylobacter sp. 19-13652]